MKKTTPASTFRKVPGGVTAASGFVASGVTAGIKRSKGLDLGLIYSEAPCAMAGTFTTNAVRAACVNWNEKLLPSEEIHAIITNSGNANACTGKQGVEDIKTVCKQLSALLGIKKDAVLMASTGVIGEFLPMDKLTAAIPHAVDALSSFGGNQYAKAIMTTDTVEKEYAITVGFPKGEVTIGGCVKGSGMIHPKMATMLGYITTDGAIAATTLEPIVKRVVDWTFNNLTVDGDTSTNDMVLVAANGMSGVEIKTKADLQLFQDALFEVMNTLCAKIAEDGEGATKRIEINVVGGKTYASCKAAAKAIANSNLVKTAIFGNDPNWGRILCAIGYSGADFAMNGLKVDLCGTTVFAGGRPVKFDPKKVQKELRKKVVVIDVDLGQGSKTCAVAHTCDLSYDYIKINADYHT